jgi:cell pole-organizing protein PopZ
MRQAGEPSVEEILESIKKVIARDNRAEAEQVRRRRENTGVAERAASIGVTPIEAFVADEPAPVLELTDAEMAPAASDDGYDDDLDDSGHAELEAAQMPDDDREEPPLSIDEPLLAETARSSVRESLTALAMLAEPGARPQIVRSGETSLEGLTRELLRPMLAEWLEKNLPATVDRLVAAEITRIVGKRG